MFRIPDTAPLLTARRAGIAAAACLAVAALVSGCGGGDRVKSFQPTQVIVFGDENSAFDSTSTTSSPLVTVNGVAFMGSRYTINTVTIPDQGYCATGTTPLTAIDCAASPLSPAFDSSSETATVDSSAFTTPSASGTGIQTVQLVNELDQVTLTTTATSATRSAQYSYDRYYDCSPGASAYAGNWAQYLAYSLGSNLSLGGSTQCPQDTGNGKSHAFWGATVDDVVTQLDTTYRGEMHDGVLVTVLVGQNDILAAYTAVKGGSLSLDSALTLMAQKGEALGEAVKRIPDTGARVVFLTVPDMGQTPQAVIDGQAALATALTHAFNEGYNNSGGLVLGAASQMGHKIVKVDAYTQINALVASYPVAVAACDPTLIKRPDGTAVSSTDDQEKLLNCTNLTLISGATLTSHLWADGWHLAPVGHVSLGSLAVSRIRDQL